MNEPTESADPLPADDPERSVIDITITGCDGRLAEDLIRAARLALKHHGIQTGQLEIAVVDDVEMCAQHQRWLDDDTPTDALTFDLRDDDAEDSLIDGQLIVCETVARNRAIESGHDWSDELTLYVVHGCLHLCGFDDKNPTDAERMHAEEDRLLVAVGRPPIFASGERVRTQEEGGAI